MRDLVMIVNTDRKIKATIAATRLLDTGIPFWYEVVVSSYTVSVREGDVKMALEMIARKDFWERG